MTSASIPGQPPTSVATKQAGTPHQDRSVGGVSPAQSGGTVAPADHVLTLVSSCVVNQRAFANTCGVPLGAHIDLLPSSALRLPQAARPPLRCNGCSGFLNVYCKTNLLKWVWKCNMCGCVNINKEQLGASADIASYPELWNEAVEYVMPLPPGAVPAPPSSPHLVFVVDTSMEPRDLRAAKDALLSLLTGPGLHPSTRISLLTFDGCVAVHNLGAARCCHVLPTVAATRWTNSSAASAGGAGGGGGGSSANFDGGGSNGSNGDLRSAAAAVLNGAAGGDGSSELHSAVQQLLDRYCVATAAGGSGGEGGEENVGEMLVSELRSCVRNLSKVLDSWRTVAAEGVPVRARARSLCPAIEAALVLVAAAACTDPSHTRPPTSLYGSRVVVLAGAPPTRGPGALPLELLDAAVAEKGRGADHRAVAASLDVGAALGALGARLGVRVDIFTSTATGIHARLLTAITHGSGGELFPTLTAPPTHLQVAHPPHPHPHPPAEAAHTGFLAPLLSAQMGVALGRVFGVAGRLDCYCSEGLRLLQWMGSVDPLEAEELEASAAQTPAGAPAAAAATAASSPPAAARGGGVAGGVGGATPWRLSSSACVLGTVEAGRGAALRLEVTRDLGDVAGLLLQVALHWIDPLSRCRVIRVVSRRLGVVESRAEFLRSVNPAAAAVLLGKRAVLEAKKAGAFRDARRAEEARLAVAAQLGLVATRCGVEVQASRGLLGFGGRKLRLCPPELLPLAHALYHFQRGPGLGPSLQPPLSPPTPSLAFPIPTAQPPAAASLHALWDSDVRLTALNALLRAAWVDAYRAMAPQLYAVLPQQPALTPQQSQPPQPSQSVASEALVALGSSSSFPQQQLQQLQSQPSQAYQYSMPSQISQSYQPPAPPQLAALPCVSLAAVMARTVPLLLDTGIAVLVSPTEEPGHEEEQFSGGSERAASDSQRASEQGRPADGGSSDGGLTPALLAAALHAVRAGCGTIAPPPSQSASPLPSLSSYPSGGSSVDGAGDGGGGWGVPRVPLPCVVLAPGAQGGGGSLAARLTPVHRDRYEDQAAQHPALEQLGHQVADQLSKQLGEGGAAAAAAATAAAVASGVPAAAAVAAVAAAGVSFVEWCRGVGVQAFMPSPSPQR